MRPRNSPTSSSTTSSLEVKLAIAIVQAIDQSGVSPDTAERACAWACARFKSAHKFKADSAVLDELLKMKREDKDKNRPQGRMGF